MMLMDREFRKGLDECLGRLWRGDDVRSCLEAYPKYADRLEPYLSAASTLRGLSVPRPSAGAQQSARRRLLNAVTGDGPLPRAGGVTWVPAPLLRAGTVALALFMFLIAAIGASAALGGGDAVSGVLNALNLPNPIGGDDHSDDEGVELRGRVISVSRFGLGLRSDGDVLVVWYSDDTKFEDADGEPISGKELALGMDSFVLYTEGVMRTFLTDSETVVEGSLAPFVFADVSGWQREDGSFLARHVKTYPLEFWATVVSVASSSLTVKVEGSGPNVVVHTGGAEFTGQPFAGVKVWVTAYKKADGSYQALHVTVKTAEIYGAVTAKIGSTYTVTKDGAASTVTTNGGTVFVGTPSIGSVVTVYAYKMGDGTFLAYKIIVKEGVFSGAITQLGPAANTIYVNVGGNVKEGCTEFADIIGTLVVGATVEVHVDHTEGSTYFAALVKVTG